MKDIQIDIQSRDLQFLKIKDNSAVRSVEWRDGEEAAYMVVLVPDSEKDTIAGDDFAVNIHANYHPSLKNVIVSFALTDSKGQQLGSGLGMNFALKSYYCDFLNPCEVPACKLPVIDVHGNFTLHVKDGEAYIYSQGRSDISFVESAGQEANLLNIAAPGHHYRYPTIGVDSHNYINSVPSHTNLGKKIMQQYSNDEKTVQSAEFDADAGTLSVEFGCNEVDDYAGASDLKVPELLVPMLSDDDIRNIMNNEL